MIAIDKENMDQHARERTFEITHITIDGRTYLATGQMRFMQDHLVYNAPGGIRLSAGSAPVASVEFRIPTIVDGEIVEDNTSNVQDMAA